MFKKISFILFVILSSQLMASECVSNVDANFANDGMSVTAISDKGLSNVVLQFADGSEQKFEIGKDGQYSLDFSGTGSNEGKIITGVWIKSGCEQSGDGSGYGEYIAACDPGLIVNLGSDQSVVEPLRGTETLLFELRLNQPITVQSCVVSVSYSTSNGASGQQSAIAGIDYESISGSVDFEMGGSLDQVIAVTILPDTVFGDPAVAFSLNVDAVEFATVGDGSAIGVIFPQEF